jgi:hypothetical protein
MDFDALVEEIVSRVSAKLAEREGTAEPTASAGEDKPGLLVLTQEHGTCCHQMLESSRLQEYYKTACALLSDYQCDVADYEAIILYDLTIDAMSRIAGGVCDTPFTALVQKAILLGKKLFVPREAVELYRYAQTVPSAYYNMLQEKLTLLEQSGLVICTQDTLEDVILGEASAQPAPAYVPFQAAAPEKACVPSAGREVSLTKHVITERDLAAVYDRDLTCVRVGKRTILTDLAREYAAVHKVKIVREE